MDNKLKIKQDIEYSLLVIWALLTVMTCASVWNFVSEIVFVIAAALLFVFNIVAAVKIAKQIGKIENKDNR